MRIVIDTAEKTLTAAGRRLDEGQAECFRNDRRNDDRGSACVMSGKRGLVDLADETNVGVRGILSREAFPELAFADDDKLNVRHARDDLDKFANSLERHNPAGEHDPVRNDFRRLCRPREGRE